MTRTALRVAPELLTCGTTKPYDRIRPPLVCNQPAGHDGPHGVSIAGLPPYVTWSESR